MWRPTSWHAFSGCWPPLPPHVSNDLQPSPATDVPHPTACPGSSCVTLQDPCLDWMTWKPVQSPTHGGDGNASMGEWANHKARGSGRRVTHLGTTVVPAEQLLRPFHTQTIEIGVRVGLPSCFPFLVLYTEQSTEALQQLRVVPCRSFELLARDGSIAILVQL